jgi:alkyldihydroxyacetonephosphate synthase
VELAALLAERVQGLVVSASAADQVAYARDLWPRRLLDVRAGQAAATPPAAVVWPSTTEQVAALVAFAREEGLSLVPFGAGSGVCGAVLPDSRSVIVDLKRMASFSIDRDAPLLDVGPGALGISLEEELERAGYTIGHFPSSILCSTVGGWLAARGAGQCSGLYGKIEDMVVSAECVLGNGQVVDCRRRTQGPNLVPLLIGSEGTLGVITRCKLRLHPVPSARAFAAFGFRDIEAGWDALSELFQNGLRPAVSRLYDPLDSVMLKQGAVKSERRPGTRNKNARLGRVLYNALRAPSALNAAIQALEGNLLGGSTLVLVFEGATDAVHGDCERASELCLRAGAKAYGEGPARAWLEHRYSVSYRQSPVFRLGAFSDTMEVAAPWSKLPGLYAGVRRALGRHVLVMAHLSHAYPDGCSIYFTFSAAGSDDADAGRIYDRAWRDALDAAIGCGATLSHHHGVGRSKAPALGKELGVGIELIQQLMRAWDPSRIMNPGNLVPREPNAGQATAVAAAPASFELDERSLLCTVSGTQPLDRLEAELFARGYTLGLAAAPGAGLDVARWIASGLPGASDPWSDPVAQQIAGLRARLARGGELVIRPAPRRAVGPDLFALFAGAGERVGVVTSANLCVRRRSAPGARALPFTIDRDPPLSAAESGAWERVIAAIGSAR